MKLIKKLLLIFFLILFILLIIYKVVFQIGLVVESQESEESQKLIANQSLTVVKFLSKGGQIDYGPSQITNEDLNKYPAILSQINQSNINGKYLMIASYGVNGVYIVMNETDIIKEVPSNNFAFN